MPDNEPTVYHVHIFAVVRVRVAGITAPSHQAAAEQAHQQVPTFQQRFHGSDCDYADEISHYLVDVAGDEDFRNSRWFYSQDQPLFANLQRLLAWHDGHRDAAELDAIIADARQAIAASL